MLICKQCKKEIYSTINDKCYSCYNYQKQFELTDKIIASLGTIILIVWLFVIIKGV